jgi:hypothetical protein
MKVQENPTLDGIAAVGVGKQMAFFVHVARA